MPPYDAIIYRISFIFVAYYKNKKNDVDWLKINMGISWVLRDHWAMSGKVTLRLREREVGRARVHVKREAAQSTGLMRACDDGVLHASVELQADAR